MIDLDAYLTQHCAARNVPLNVINNATDLLPKVRALLADPDCPNPNAGLRSGYRPPAFNAGVHGAAPNSNHMTGHAIDLDDNDGALDAWISDAILERYGLYRESPDHTPSWIHLQDVPPHSGHRTYIP